MKRRALDTNRLIRIWQGKLPHPGRFGTVSSSATAVEAARRWLEVNPNDVLVTPVRLEFLGGTRDKDELTWADAFLGEFELVDGGDVIPQDWREAERLARRVRPGGRSRGALDCIILAVCTRLHIDLHSNDTGMPR